MDRVYARKVMLEHSRVRDINGRSTFEGLIRVYNAAFEKNIIATYTRDMWLTRRSVAANFIVSDGPLWDLFYVKLDISDLQPSDEIHFFIQYSVDGSDYYDSNHDYNYKIFTS
jgi:hypothetical protein